MSSSKRLEGKRVVIVEDESLTQLQLRKALTRAGLVVAGFAMNGEAGVEVVLRERPDIVLMDINMPIMNGLDASRLILDSYNVCIFIITANEEHREQARQIGVCGYAIKPIVSESLFLELQAAYLKFQRRNAPEHLPNPE